MCPGVGYLTPPKMIFDIVIRKINGHLSSAEGLEEGEWTVFKEVSAITVLSINAKVNTEARGLTTPTTFQHL